MREITYSPGRTEGECGSFTLCSFTAAAGAYLKYGAAMCLGMARPSSAEWQTGTQTWDAGTDVAGNFCFPRR